MLLSVLFALAMLQPSAVVAAAPPCAGADPAIVAVKKLRTTTDARGVDHFRVAVTVKNFGKMKQAGNTLDSVVMYQNEIKTDTKGLQPLARGASQTVVFSLVRAIDTEAGSTNLRFAVEFKAPDPPGNQDCNAGNDAATLEV